MYSSFDFRENFKSKGLHTRFSACSIEVLTLECSGIRIFKILGNHDNNTILSADFFKYLLQGNGCET